MRELKFRTWKMHNGKLRRCVFSPFGLIEYAQRHPEAPVLHNEDVNDIKDFMPNADVIEQYTGLKDKNGKEIYEGDIIREKWFDEDVRLGENRVGKVEYFTDGFVCWFVGGRLMQLGMLVGSHIEVIGNIHESPELLEQKDAKD